MIREVWHFSANDMITKDEITTWLKLHGRSRKWLAQECGISEGTMNNGFSQGFSDATLATIDKLMKLDLLAADTPKDETGLITFTTAEFERIERARLAVGNPPRPEFYRNAIIQYLDDQEELDAIQEAKERDDLALLADENGPAGELPRQPVKYPTGKGGRKK